MFEVALEAVVQSAEIRGGSVWSIGMRGWRGGEGARRGGIGSRGARLSMS